jgi:alpha-ketoglutarate-dependent taurine dioxygenase
MDAQRVLLTQEQVNALHSSDQAIAEFAQRIAGMLRSFPHFLVLKGPPVDDNGALTLRLCERIAGAGLSKRRQERLSRKLDVTRVEIDPTVADVDTTKQDGTENYIGTKFSRTNQSLDLHTDSTFSDRPHELVAFQFVRSDPQGGDTLIAPIESVMSNLPDDVRRLLSQRKFPFQRRSFLPQLLGHLCFPVLWKKNGGWNIRYYREQINLVCANDGSLKGRYLDALDALDSALQRHDVRFQFHVGPGETVYLHNTKVLHGRTAFSAKSDRLMYRVRVNAAPLH